MKHRCFEGLEAECIKYYKAKCNCIITVLLILCSHWFILSHARYNSAFFGVLCRQENDLKIVALGGLPATATTQYFVAIIVVYRVTVDQPPLSACTAYLSLHNIRHTIISC